MRDANFLIAGERRSGTTSLYHWLKGHPDVFLPANVDSFFFLEEELKGTQPKTGQIAEGAWERSHSITSFRARFAAARNETAVGEKCADLLFWTRAHRRLAEHLPGIRLLVTLRHPVRRAWSHYWNEVGKGRETLSFVDAIDAEASRAEESDWARFHLSYVARGFYAENLRRLFEFIPAERVKVVLVERNAKDPAGVGAEVAEFLGLDPAEFPPSPFAARNQNWTTILRPWVRRFGLERLDAGWTRGVKRVCGPLLRGRPRRWEREREIMRSLSWPFRAPARVRTMDPDTFRRLASLFEPHIRELEHLLGDPIPEWRE